MIQQCRSKELDSGSHPCENVEYRFLVPLRLHHPRRPVPQRGLDPTWD